MFRGDRGAGASPIHAAVVAIRSLHGQRGRSGTNLEHTQPRVSRRLASELIGLFHSTTFANLVALYAMDFKGRADSEA